MITSFVRAILAAAGAVALAGLSTHAQAASLMLIGSSTKICQLTGDTDWLTGQPTAARTNTRFGLVAVDLGFPVDSSRGPLFFLFGDARPSTTGNPIPPDDAMGWTNRTTPPDASTCLGLNLVSAAPGTFAHPTVEPAILQGSFNVPTGGVFVNDDLFAFFWTNHCVAAQPLAPMPNTPLQFPAPSAGCPESPTFNSIGRSVLAAAEPSKPAAFRQPIVREHFPPINPPARMPNGFVYVTAAQPPATMRAPPIGPGFVPPGHLDVIPVFGVARYRASIPYLALAPRPTFANPSTWSFFAGYAAGHPTFVTYQEWDSGRSGNEWAPPANAELYPDAVINGIDERCVGEHSVTWNAALQRWLLLYVCGPYRVEARTALEPWGPWSQPTVLLSLLHDPGIVCTLIMNPNKMGCGSLEDYWKPTMIGGFFYAPFVMERFTQNLTPSGSGANPQAQIYWLVSTWNPYQVIVMTSTLELAPN